MFFPKAMSEIELIVPSKDLVSVTKILGGRSIFHQVEAGSFGAGKENQRQDGWAESAAAYTALERRIQTLLQNLGLEPAIVQPVEVADPLDLEQARTAVDKIEQEIRQVGDAIAETSKTLESLKSHKQQLTTIADIDLDIKTIQQSRYLLSMLGTMPAANVARLKTSLARVPHVLVTLREDSHRPVLWLGATTSNQDVLERAARSAYFEPLALPAGYEGSPRKVIEGIDSKIAETERELAKLRTELASLARKHGASLTKLASEIQASRRLAEAITKYGRLRHTYVIVGWAPTDELDRLLAKIRKASKETIIETTRADRAGDRRNVPVAMHSSWLLRPFQTLVTTYARPKYGEVDPTILVALTYPLLFGAMFGDVGHGLVLAALGVLLSSRRVKKLQSMAGLGGLLTVCGLLATVFGFLYGSIFGFEHVLHAVWMQPLEDPLTILIVAVVAGLAILSVGFLLGMFNAIVSRDWGHLLFGHGGVAAALLYWSFLGLGASLARLIPVPWLVFGIIAALTSIMIMFSEVLIRLVEGERPLIEGGLPTYGIQAFFELFEVVLSYLSNSLSYVRVGAFAIAHVVLSSVVFVMAELLSPAHGVGYWLVVSLGNIGIILYEGLIVGIQAMRLSYYEFFSKFFAGGGMEFEPLALIRRQASGSGPG